MSVIAATKRFYYSFGQNYCLQNSLEAVIVVASLLLRMTPRHLLHNILRQKVLEYRTARSIVQDQNFQDITSIQSFHPCPCMILSFLSPASDSFRQDVFPVPKKKAKPIILLIVLLLVLLQIVLVLLLVIAEKSNHNICKFIPIILFV